MRQNGGNGGELGGPDIPIPSNSSMKLSASTHSHGGTTYVCHFLCDHLVPSQGNLGPHLAPSKTGKISRTNNFSVRKLIVIPFLFVLTDM